METEGRDRIGQHKMLGKGHHFNMQDGFYITIAALAVLDPSVKTTETLQ